MSPSQIFKACTLTGHRSGIECLAISPDGLHLVSGGASSLASLTNLTLISIANGIDDDACVFIWNLTSGESLQKIHCPFNGAISAIVWVRIWDSTDPTFVFGCADGSLHMYRRKGENVRFVRHTTKHLTYHLREQVDFSFLYTVISAHAGPVEDLCFDNTHLRMASVGSGHPQLWNISGFGKPCSKRNSWRNCLTISWSQRCFGSTHRETAKLCIDCKKCNVL